MLKNRLLLVSILIILMFVCGCGTSVTVGGVEVKDGGTANSTVKSENEKEDPRATALYEKIVGNYTCNGNYSGAFGDYVTVNSDRTITADGATYPYEIRVVSDDYAALVVMLDKNNSRHFDIYESPKGYVGFDIYYNKESLDIDAKVILDQLVGDYVRAEGHEEKNNVSISSDYCIIIEGERYPIDYKYSYFDDKFTFFYNGPEGEMALRMETDAFGE